MRRGGEEGRRGREGEEDRRFTSRSDRKLSESMSVSGSARGPGTEGGWPLAGLSLDQGVATPLRE